jgi:predicted  nucleic acid-binding Zn ribbon protein
MYVLTMRINIVKYINVMKNKERKCGHCGTNVKYKDEDRDGNFIKCPTCKNYLAVAVDHDPKFKK